MKQYRNKLIITSILILLPMLVGFMFWDKLPDTMATHFNFDNAANGWSNKYVAVIGLPIFLLVLHYFCIFVTLNDPKKKNIGKSMLSLIFWIIPACSLFANGSIIFVNLGMKINVTNVASLLVGLVFICLGNYMSKNQQNFTVGIRCPWTLNSENNWIKTHRFASWLYVLAGISFIINMFIGSLVFPLVMILVATICPLVYSFLIYKKEKTEESPNN